MGKYKARTAKVNLHIKSNDGNDFADTEVTVTQKKSEFLFGCNIFALKPEDNSESQLAYRKYFSKLYNYATLPFYWGSFEKEQAEPDAFSPCPLTLNEVSVSALGVFVGVTFLLKISPRFSIVLTFGSPSFQDAGNVFPTAPI